MATAANTVVDTDNDVVALALKQPFVAIARGVIHRRRQFDPALLEFGEFLF